MCGLEGKAFWGELAALIEEKSDLLLGVVVEESIDFGDEFWGSLTNLPAAEGPWEFERGG